MSENLSTFTTDVWHLRSISNKFQTLLPKPFSLCIQKHSKRNKSSWVSFQKEHWGILTWSLEVYISLGSLQYITIFYCLLVYQWRGVARIFKEGGVQIFFCLKTPTYLVAILNFDILTASCYVPDKNLFRLEHRWKKVRKLSVGKSKMDASNNQHFSHTRHENPTQISKHWRYTNKYRSN